MEFVIDRRTWIRGQHSRDNNQENLSLLLREDGFKCCLGFFALSCGYQESDIYNKGYPEELIDSSKFPEDFRSNPKYHYNQATFNIINVNDSQILSNSQIEEALIFAFAKYDIVVTFEG